MKLGSLVPGTVALLVLAATANAEMPSTPAELAQTRALNASAVAGTYTSPQVLNGERSAQPPAARVASAPEPVHDLDARTNLNPDDFVVLKTVDPARLGGLSVEDATGIAIGRVNEVTLARDGTAAELSIELNDGRRVRVSEAALRYNPNDRVPLTNIGIGELRALASVED